MGNKPIENRFTVLELIGLMGVLLLVGTIVGALMTVHHRSHEKVFRSACSGNLKQMSLAMFGYSADNVGAFPLTPHGNSFIPLDENHSNDLANSKVYDCPSHATLERLASNSDYWYVGSVVRDDVKDPEHVVLAYDMFGNHPNNEWMNVLYADGHVGGGKPGKDGLFDNSHAVRRKINVRRRRQ